MNRTVPLALAAVAALALLVPAAVPQPATRVHGVFDGDTMYTAVPLDAIPAIRQPTHVAGAAADSQMSAHESIMGVAAGDDAHRAGVAL